MSGSLRILIVDDHPIVRQGLRQTLADASEIGEIVDAATPHEALDLVRQHRWDAVILGQDPWSRAERAARTGSTPKMAMSGGQSNRPMARAPAASGMSACCGASGGGGPLTTLTAAALSNSHIQLSWTRTSTNEAGFYIERSTDGTNNRAEHQPHAAQFGEDRRMARDDAFQRGVQSLPLNLHVLQEIGLGNDIDRGEADRHPA